MFLSLKVYRLIKPQNMMGRANGFAFDHSELRIARNLVADVSAKKVVQTLASGLLALFLFVCANTLLGLVGRLGFVDLDVALLLVSPFYFVGLGRIWSAFGVSFW